VASYLFWGP